ncbi:MBL fold metallo-hydrolase [Paenibacillus sp. GCM10027626]|uniref:MBL fold metallo-hydrolase n=1 Tax=Paenibacillus sp. GCM10027626 TaxID=3273411 RepID=UPI00363A2B88
MIQISERVYLIGSGKDGSELSHPKDCNVFLLDGGTEAVLIDAGSGLAHETLVANIAATGIPLERVKRVLLTHIHGDHAAGAYDFYAGYGMEIAVSAEAAPWLEQGDMEKTSLTAAQRAGVYPQDFRYPACPASRRLSEGDVLTVGDISLQVLDTPGHSRGHISFVLNEGGVCSLFSGDALFAGGKIYIQNSWDCSIQDYAATIAKLHALRADRLYPGHGACLLARAHEHSARAQACFERLDIPPNL